MTSGVKTNVCIVGVGLIGGSLGLALRKQGRYAVTGFGRNAAKLKTALKKGAIDGFEIDAKRAVETADIVVLCVPVHLIAPQLSQLVRWLKQGAIITDVGSVKRSVVIDANKVLKIRPDVRFVGAHPIAGSEKTGVEYSTPILFEKATCVITTDSAPATALKTIHKLWSTAGARCINMKAADHDRYLALTSHLPHLLAFSLFQCVSDAAKKNPVIKSLVAGSFRDMTRIAGADPELWGGVLETNRSEIQKSVKAASKQLLLLGRSPLSKLIPALRKLQRAKSKWITTK